MRLYHCPLKYKHKQGETNNRDYVCHNLRENTQKLLMRALHDN